MRNCIIVRRVFCLLYEFNRTVFQMYKAHSKEDILKTLDSYTHGIKCLPRDWDADHKIDPPPPTKKLGDELEEIDEDRRHVYGK